MDHTWRSGRGYSCDEAGHKRRSIFPSMAYAFWGSLKRKAKTLLNLHAGALILDHDDIGIVPSEGQVDRKLRRRNSTKKDFD